MNAIVLLGAPGAGKGTIAASLNEQWGAIHFSTGDMLRAAIKQGAPVGRQAEAFIQRGELVPDRVIMDLVIARLDQGKPEACYLFDGFPRTGPQAVLLDAELERRRAKLDVVFLLEVSTDVIVDRLSGRRVCRSCEANYHIRNIPPRVEGRCDRCGGELFQRPDDTRETILNRLEVYRRQTEELISYYDRKGVLVRVDSNRSRDPTVADINRSLERLMSRPAEGSAER